MVRARIPLIVANMRRMYEAGALIVAGSDAGIGPVKPHDVLRHAPAKLREIGFGQAEALRTITSVAAGVIGLGHRKGRIAPGFDADILAVDGDPIADPGRAAPDPGGMGSRHRRAGHRVASWRNAGGQPSSGSSVMRSSAVSMPLRQTERAMILLGSTRSR